jgi:hypothetical protein
MIDENRKLEISGVVNAQRFFQQIYLRLSGIITTNYDLLVEYALGTKGFNYGYANQILMGRGPYPISRLKKPVILTGKVPLAKIHGSISWDENGYYSDGRRGITGNALLVAPIPEKKPPELLRSTWDIAEKILKSSNRLIVFGFAFNPYDEAVLNMLRNTKGNIKSVLIIDVEPKMDRVKLLWPAAKIRTCQPPPIGESAILNWLNET